MTNHIKTWRERMPEPRVELQCTMNCSPRNGPCDDCVPVNVHGDPIAARDAEIAELRAALGEHPEPDISTRQGKLRDLADRIDHEKLWRTAGMYRDDWTDDQRARYEAGVMLRRYAEILQPGRWLVIPPTGPMRFGAETLESVTEMAQRHYATIGGPLCSHPRLVTSVIGALTGIGWKCAECGAPA